MMSITSVLVAQDRFVAFDLVDHLAVLVDQLFDFQPDELNELQSADRLGLRLAEQHAGLSATRSISCFGNLRCGGMIRRDAERALAQFLDRFLARLAAADQPDHLVDIAAPRRSALRGCARAAAPCGSRKPRAADDHFLAVLDEVLDQLLQPHRPRLAIDQRDVDHADRDLARRVLVQLVASPRSGSASRFRSITIRHLCSRPESIVDRADVLDQVFLHRTRRSDSTIVLRMTP